MKKILTSAIAVGSAMTLAMLSAAQVFALDENALQDGIFNEQAIAEQQFVNSFSDETTREVAEYYLNGGLSLEETADMVKIYEEGMQQIAVSEQSIVIDSPFYSTTDVCKTKHYIAAIQKNPQYAIDEIFDIVLDTSHVECDATNNVFVCFPYADGSCDLDYTITVPKSLITSKSTTIRTMVNAKARTDSTAVPMLRYKLDYAKGFSPKSENDIYTSVDLTRRISNGYVEIETYALGDVDHNGVVDAKDQSYVTQVLIGKINDFDFSYSDGEKHYSPAISTLAADVNQDNVIDMQDAIQIGKYVSGQSSTLVD